MPEMKAVCQWTNGIYVVQTGPEAIDFDAVYAFLSQAPWAAGMSREAMTRSLSNSLCFSLLENGRQIGLARVITDFVTYAYVCDVYIMESRRKRGLGSWLMRCVMEHPELTLLKRIALLTHDAQDFYLRLGFRFGPSDQYMERIVSLPSNPDLSM